MFAGYERLKTTLHIRSAFACARVKSARICWLIERLIMSRADENRIET